MAVDASTKKASDRGGRSPPTVNDDVGTCLLDGRGDGGRAGRKLWSGGEGDEPLGADLERAADLGRNEEERRGCGRDQRSDRAGGAGMFFLRHERGMRGMVRREEERAVRQPLEAVDVPESSPERERREGEHDEQAPEPGQPHGGILHACKGAMGIAGRCGA
jgi:hypothetical protein